MFKILYKNIKHIHCMYTIHSILKAKTFIYNLFGKNPLQHFVCKDSVQSMIKLFCIPETSLLSWYTYQLLSLKIL